jgi:ADP-heptose:LPS heptosyltransferase
MTDRKILVLAAGSLGDAILTLPALQALQGLGTVSLSGTPAYLQLGAELLGLDRVTLLDPVLQAGELPRPFDEVFLFLKEDAAAQASRMRSGATRVLVPPFPFTDFLSRPRPAHLYWNATVEAAHPGRVFQDKPTLQVPDSLKRSGRKILETLHLTNPILIHPGSGGRAKNSPLSFFRQAAEKAGGLGMPVLVVWGEAEENRLGEFKEAFQGMEGVWRLEEPLTLPNLVGVMANARGYLGNDSGPTHLASACGLPVLAVFGPTDARVWAPPGADVFQAGRDFGVLGEVDPTPVIEGWLGSISQQHI